MTRMLALALILVLVCLPASAASYTAPTVPDSGQALMPEDTADFGKALLELVRKALTRLRPDLAQCARVCAGVLGAAILTGLLRCFSGTEKGLVNLAGVLVVSALLGTTANSMISLGRETIVEISSYGKLLLPVMTAALAGQGGVSTSAALYVGTAAFDTALGGVIANLLIPMVYGFLVLGIGVCALGEPTLGKLQELLKGLVTWTLKTMLIVFTSYMGITGVVSGTTDAAALKAAKLTMSTVVPVVGSVLSDASESVLVGMGTMKNAAGIYGILAAGAIFLEPFLKIGVHYLSLKVTGTLCAALSDGELGKLVDSFSGAMGLMLAMTGASCLLLFVSTVCFLKGVG